MSRTPTIEADRLPNALSRARLPASVQRTATEWLWAGVFAIHLLWVLWTARGGWLSAAMDVLFLSAMLLCSTTRRMAILAVPLWLVCVAYKDILPWALSLRGGIHVGDLYDAEVAYFGVATANGRQTLCEWFLSRHWPAVDLVCGLVYVGFQIQMAPYAIWLYFADQRRLSLLMWTYLVVHLAGFTTYVLYPAAPPWYVLEYGRSVVMDVPANPAGVARLDDLLGFGLAASVYAQGSNVFGAMPSLHVALATVFVLVSWGMGWRWFVPSTIVLLLMLFGAVYFCHHYVLDLICGLFYAFAGFEIVRTIQRSAFHRNAMV